MYEIRSGGKVYQIKIYLPPDFMQLMYRRNSEFIRIHYEVSFENSYVQKLHKKEVSMKSNSSIYQLQAKNMRDADIGVICTDA